MGSQNELPSCRCCRMWCVVWVHAIFSTLWVGKADADIISPACTLPRIVVCEVRI